MISSWWWLGIGKIDANMAPFDRYLGGETKKRGETGAYLL
jgi:hypothetical protein